MSVAELTAARWSQLRLRRTAHLRASTDDGHCVIPHADGGIDRFHAAAAKEADAA